MTPGPVNFNPKQSSTAMQKTGPEHRRNIPVPDGGGILSALWRITWLLTARWTPNALNLWRRLLLRLFGARVGSRVFIHPSSTIRYPWHLSIGDRTFIHHRVLIDCNGPVSIGQDNHISQYTHLCTGTRNYTDLRMQILPQPITLSDRVWLAADVFIGPGVSIGSDTIVGARASIFGDLPDAVIAVGDGPTQIRARDDLAQNNVATPDTPPSN